MHKVRTPVDTARRELGQGDVPEVQESLLGQAQTEKEDREILEQLADYEINLRTATRRILKSKVKDRVLNNRTASSCEICYEAFVTTRSIRVDHDHVSGLARGLLCNRCNVALGMFRDSPRILLNALAYVNQFTEKLSKRRGNGTVDLFVAQWILGVSIGEIRQLIRDNKLLVRGHSKAHVPLFFRQDVAALKVPKRSG